MYFHVAAYAGSIGNTANTDVNAAADGVLGVRNNHLILTNPYSVLAAMPYGAVISRARWGDAMLNRYGKNHLWPLSVSATIQSNPPVLDYRDSPLALPQNEEITIEVTNTALGPTATGCILWLGTPEWNMNFPAFQDRLKTRATATIVAATVSTWSAEADLTFEQNLLAGVYAVVGAHVVAPNALAFRFRFPDQPAVRGRQHRPGGLVQDSAATIPLHSQSGGWGEWGRFHTFNPPTIQVFGDAAGGTYEIRLDLLYLGEDETLLGNQ